MNDYKELIEELKRNGLSNGGRLGHHSGLCEEAADAIEQLVKERDAEPVRHGHWIELWFDEEDRLLGELPSDYKCSVCGGIVPRKTFQSGKYCPNCGAKMDEVSE